MRNGGPSERTCVYDGVGLDIWHCYEDVLVE